MITDFNRLNSKDLLEQLAKLVCTENETTVQILLYLLELEKRELYLELGYSSLFDFCVRKLRYSEGAAARRIRAARTIKDYPQVYELLLSRELSLSTICHVASLLKPENAAEILAAVRGKGKTEVENFVKFYNPVTKKPTERIRPLALAKAPSKAAATPLELFSAPLAEPGLKKEEESAASASNPSAAPEKRYELKFSIDQETAEQLNRAKVLISRGTGKAVSLEEVLKLSLKEYLKVNDPAEREKRREEREQKAAKAELPPLAVVEKIEEFPTKRSRHIPRAISDQVFLRDQGRCSFVGPDGTRCGSAVGIQLDHLFPFGVGGEHSASNLRLTCKHHNSLQAKKFYGKEVMAQYQKTSGSS